MTSPCNANGDAMDYRDLPIKMRLRLRAKALRKRKIAAMAVPSGRHGFRLRGWATRITVRFSLEYRRLIRHGRKWVAHLSRCILAGFRMGRFPLLNGHSTSGP